MPRAGGSQRGQLRDDGRRRGRLHQGRVRRTGPPLRPPGTRVVPAARRGQRRSRDDQRGRHGQPRRGGRRGHRAELRRRRSRGRHDRRRRAADAGRGLQADGGGVLRQRGRGPVLGPAGRRSGHRGRLDRTGGRGAVHGAPGAGARRRPRVRGRGCRGCRCGPRRRPGRRLDLPARTAVTLPEIDCYSTARAMVAAVAAKEISARELLELALDRITAVNGAVNAVVSLDEERARAGAAAADEHLARGHPTGALHGLPHAFKDTHEVAGWRTTFGSPLRADYVPRRDELIVERVRRAGVVPIGKTNVPEWAAGSHTFNPLFGTTRNPYDLTRSAGGSSGGGGGAPAPRLVAPGGGRAMGGGRGDPPPLHQTPRGGAPRGGG